MNEKIWLFFHILGAVIFLGNIIVTFFWKVLANRTKDPRVLAFSQKMVTKTDRSFTAVGATVLAITGYHYATAHDFSLMEPWMLWAQVAFYASAVIWALVLLPIQHKQDRMATEFASGGEIPDRYWRLAHRWNWVGTIATVLPLISLYFMVTKQAI